MHGPLCRAIGAFRRYVQCATRRSGYEGGRNPAYDGAALAWFDSLEALREAARTPEFARLREDLPRFMANERSPSILAREHVVID